MTKIEQWQEWAKQYNELREKLSSAIPDLYKWGHVKYNIDNDRIEICTANEIISLPVDSGKELLSVLKQLYE